MRHHERAVDVVLDLARAPDDPEHVRRERVGERNHRVGGCAPAVAPREHGQTGSRSAEDRPRRGVEIDGESHVLELLVRERRRELERSARRVRGVGRRDRAVHDERAGRGCGAATGVPGRRRPPRGQGWIVERLVDSWSEADVGVSGGARIRARREVGRVLVDQAHLCGSRPGKREDRQGDEHEMGESSTEAAHASTPGGSHESGRAAF